MKKQFKDTKVGKFLKSIGSTLGDNVGDILPDSGFLGVQKGCFFIVDEIFI